jgi:hypothetical protein
VGQLTCVFTDIHQASIDHLYLVAYVSRHGAMDEGKVMRHEASGKEIKDPSWLRRLVNPLSLAA